MGVIISKNAYLEEERYSEVNGMSLKFVPDVEDVVEGLGIPGIAAVVLLPVVVPVAGKVLKPVAKATIKGGIVLYQKGKGILAEVGEGLEDIIAEAMAELEEAQQQALPAGDAETTLEVAAASEG
jgi:cobalamin biosynthesis Co2+ chelatase CbiK